MSLISILPFIFVVIISLTDEQTLAMNGYQFVPEKLSLYAYHYIISAGENILLQLRCHNSGHNCLEP